MANLDKLLRRIEKNHETANEVTTYPLTIAGETFEVLTMTQKEKRDFYYKQEIGKNSRTVGDIVKMAKPFIYKSLQLSQLAVKAKDAGYIASYYDVVEALFTPDELVEIISFITEINKLDKVNPETDEVEEAKKQ